MSMKKYTEAMFNDYKQQQRNKMIEASASDYLLLVAVLHFLIKFRASIYCFAIWDWSTLPLSQIEGDI